MKIWAFIILEHLVILFKFIFREIIIDKPDWVSKEKRRIDYIEDQKLTEIKNQTENAKKIEIKRAVGEMKEMN